MFDRLHELALKTNAIKKELDALNDLTIAECKFQLTQVFGAHVELSWECEYEYDDTGRYYVNAVGIEFSIGTRYVVQIATYYWLQMPDVDHEFAACFAAMLKSNPDYPFHRPTDPELLDDVASLIATAIETAGAESGHA
jgi:hypothetical protein